MLPDCDRKATRHRVAFATPSYICIVFEKSRTRWHQDGNTILTKKCSYISRGKVDMQKIKNQHPHNIFLRSLKWNTVKLWRISKKKKKKQLGKRRLQPSSIHATGA